MKAIRVHELADIGGLVFEEAPDAKPFVCDVLAKVAACGITRNELDYPVWTCRAGHQGAGPGPGRVHEIRRHGRPRARRRRPPAPARLPSR